MLKNPNSTLKLVILDQITYREDNLNTPFSGIFSWVAADHSNVESLYKNGQCIYQKVYEYGELSSETIIQRDIKKITTYDNDGRVKCKSIIANGKLDGLLEIFSEGILFMTTVFKKGKKNGKWIVYHVDGSILTCDYYIDDVKQ